MCFAARSCFTYGDRPFLGFKPIEGGGYKWVSYRQFGDMVDRCRAAMKQSGVGPGDKVRYTDSHIAGEAAVVESCVVSRDRVGGWSGWVVY